MEILKFLIFPGFLWFLRYLNNEAQLDYFRLICILHVVLKGLYKTAFRGIESRPFYLWKLCQLLVRCAMYVSSVALAALCHSEMRIYTEYNNSPAAQPCWRYLWLGTLCRLFFAQHVVYLPSDLCGICNSIRKTASFVPPPKLVDNRPHWACNFPKKPTPVCSATTRISNKKEKKRKEI